MRPIVSYPVILTGDVAGTAAFYQRHFSFEPLFTSDWYMHLQSTENRRVNLAIVDGDHETVAPAGRGRAAGIILNFEVRDVDAEYEKARGRRPADPVAAVRRGIRPAAFRDRRPERGDDRHHQADPAECRVCGAPSAAGGGAIRLAVSCQVEFPQPWCRAPERSMVGG